MLSGFQIAHLARRRGQGRAEQDIATVERPCHASAKSVYLNQRIEVIRPRHAMGIFNRAKGHPIDHIFGQRPVPDDPGHPSRRAAGHDPGPGQHHRRHIQFRLRCPMLDKMAKALHQPRRFLHPRHAIRMQRRTGEIGGGIPHPQTPRIMGHRLHIAFFHFRRRIGRTRLGSRTGIQQRRRVPQASRQEPVNRHAAPAFARRRAAGQDGPGSA